MSIVSNIKNILTFTAVFFGGLSDTSAGTSEITFISKNVDGNGVVSENGILRRKGDGTVVSELGKTTTPNNTIVISRLRAGTTLAVAKNNSNILNNALAGGNKNLLIPSGKWYTYNTIRVNKDTTLSFKGKLQQLKHSKNGKSGYRHLMLIQGGNVTLNNPHLSQKGINYPHGTHSCLAIYGKNNTGDITINGGILEHGASNAFQGGVDNTVFNGTIFRDSVEHLVYASGARRKAGGPDTRPDGLTFNNCIMERRGNGLTKNLEANHIQLRSYKNIEFNNCIVGGKKKTSPNQYGILVTGVQGLTVNNTTFSDYTAGMLYVGTAYGYSTSDVTFNSVTATPASGTKYILKSSGGVVTTFNDSVFNSPLGIQGDTSVFNDCTFKPTRYYMKISKNANVIFNNCTWDYSNSTYSKAFVKESGSTVTFTGIQTKIAPEDGHSFDWGLLSIED